MTDLFEGNKLNLAKKLDESLTDTIKNSDLKDVAAEFAEALIDGMTENEILSSIPVVNLIVGVGKTAVAVRDQLFLKKIMVFLSGISDVPQEKRREMIDLINKSQEEKLKVGEKLTYILDKCDDHTDARYIAQLFTAFLEEKITYQDFLRGSRVIQTIFIGDLEYFLDHDKEFFNRTAPTEEAPTEEEFPLINVGILAFGYHPIAIEESFEKGSTSQYFTSGGDAEISYTEIGEVLKKHLTKEV